MGGLLAFSEASATEKAFNPFEEMQKMHEEIDRIFDRFHKSMMKEDMFSKFPMTFPSSPAIDLKDMGDAYLLEADIPGAKKSEINITIKDGMLKIEAKTLKEEKIERKNYLKQERYAGSYTRVITLPSDADGQNFKSDYQDGVLKITIPKKKK